MIVLDENVEAVQRDTLRTWRIHAHQIGYDIGRQGMQDTDIVPFLRIRSRITFFTRDDDFYSCDLCHARYCLVVLDVGRAEFARFTRRVLSHPRFSQARERMGRVILASHEGLPFWRLHTTVEERLPWRP